MSLPMVGSIVTLLPKQAQKKSNTAKMIIQHHDTAHWGYLSIVRGKNTYRKVPWKEAQIMRSI